MRNTARARELRNRATPAECRLWNALKNRQLSGAKFSRQMPVGPFFADFLCREHRLVVEVDGESHDFMVERDAARTRFLEAQGYRLVRITNDEVRLALDIVLDKISAALVPTPVAAQPAPPASGRGDL